MSIGRAAFKAAVKTVGFDEISIDRLSRRLRRHRRAMHGGINL